MSVKVEISHPQPPVIITVPLETAIVLHTLLQSVGGGGTDRELIDELDLALDASGIATRPEDYSGAITV